MYVVDICLPSIDLIDKVVKMFHHFHMREVQED